MGGACGAPRLLGIYLISKMLTKTTQKIQKAYIKTYEEDVKIYKDIENSQGQGAFFFENTGRQGLPPDKPSGGLPSKKNACKRGV